ncbi:MAG: Crp/Fnr family transcriptional regulator [Clostridiales bacterium]|nr:Crp/Fnr family transcriptional regulator [Clostridiales bacterium]
MTTGECSDLFVRHFPFWEQLSPQQRDFLCRSAHTAHYEKGASIHRGDQDCVGVILVKSGQVRTYLLSEEGRDVTLYRLFAGDVCMLSASCVLDTITFDVCIDAEEDTDVLIINAAAFHQLSDENIYVKCFGYQLITTRFSDVMWAMQQILFMGVDKRLAIFLWDEISKSGSDQIHMTHEQIARYMGSAREVVTRMLKYFAGEGIVELSRGGIRILDRKRLRTLTE